MVGQISVQYFQQKHLNGVISLISEIQQNEFNISITPKEQPDLKDIPNYYQKDNGNFWVVLDKEIVIGTIALLDIGNYEAALRKMFLRKEYRGTGIAKKMLNELLNWSKAKKFRKIYLGTTSSFLSAHRFYEKNGFVEISNKVLPKSFPIMSVDTKFYMYEIL